MDSSALTLILIVSALSLSVSGADDTNSTSRDGRLFSLFQVIKFPNQPCIGSGTMNGTCFTASECTQKGGIAAGSCAAGYGVCCTFSLNCGGTSSQNCTYFQSTGSDSGCCTATICPCNNNICQLRLDFLSFVINQPSTSTQSVAKTSSGEVSPGGMKSVTTATQCIMDTFAVTNPDGNAPSVICGTNTGQHMYVDASKCCNQLKFTLGTGTSAVARTWNIKVTQYSCDYPNLAPAGCTEYFFGTTSGTFQSYNFANGIHLANQKETFCFRRERGICRICYSLATKTDFQLTGTGTMQAVVTGAMSKCCGYGSAGMSSTGYDCIVIPGASKKTPSKSHLKADEICGGGKSTALTTGKSSTVCSRKIPFQLSFFSDDFEFAMKEAKIAGKTNSGLRLHYQEYPC